MPDVLEKSLKMPSYYFCTEGPINEHTLIANKLSNFTKGGYIARQTIPASKLNLTF